MDSDYDMADDEDLQWDVLGDEYSLVGQLTFEQWRNLTLKAFNENYDDIQEWHQKVLRSGFSCKQAYKILFDLFAAYPSIVRTTVLQIDKDPPIDSEFTLRMFMEATVEISPRTEETIGQSILGKFSQTQSVPIGALIITVMNSVTGWKFSESKKVVDDEYNKLIRKYRAMNDEERMKKGKSGKLQLRRRAPLQQQRKSAKKGSASVYRRCCAACAARLRLGMRPRLVCSACHYSC